MLLLVIESLKGIDQFFFNRICLGSNALLIIHSETEMLSRRGNYFLFRFQTNFCFFFFFHIISKICTVTIFLGACALSPIFNMNVSVCMYVWIENKLLEQLKFVIVVAFFFSKRIQFNWQSSYTVRSWLVIECVKHMKK